MKPGFRMELLPLSRPLQGSRAHKTINEILINDKVCKGTIMLVHRKKRPRYQIQAPLTSLIDIVFLLLIYFLLTTNFMVDEGIKIKLPQAKASAPQTEQEITICGSRRESVFRKSGNSYRKSL